MRVPIYYVTVRYHNTVGRKYWLEIEAGPFFKYRDAMTYIENNRSYEGKLEIMQDNSIDLQEVFG